jgi:hypothetical protein
MIFREKRVYILSIFLFLIFSSFFVIAVSKDNPGHTGDEVLVFINGYSMTLQEAINNNFLKDGASAPTRSYTTSVSGGYHNGDSIFINIGNQKTLKEAIDGKISFCRDQTAFRSWLFSFGHSGDKVKVSFGGQERYLQNLIDSKEFCGYSWSSGTWGSCSVSCGSGTNTRTVECKRSDGVSVGDSYCGGTKPAISQSCNEGDIFCGWVRGNFQCLSDVNGLVVTCGRGTAVYPHTCNAPGHCNCHVSPYWTGSKWETYANCVADSKEDLIGSSCGTGTDCGFGGWSEWTTCSWLVTAPTRSNLCTNVDGCVSGGVYYKKDVLLTETGDPCPAGDTPRIGGSTVLCTEAYNQGYLSKEFYKADIEYAEKYLDEAVILGYHSWAKPLVRVLRKNSEISGQVIPLSVEWGKHMAFVVGKSEVDSEVGKILLENGIIYSEELGKLLINEGYDLNNEYEFDDAFVEEVFLNNIELFSEESFAGDPKKVQENFRKIMEEIINFYLASKTY